ncbi:TraB/GumN family protein [Hymenobacter puniceus]|uniref:TraB/GumN family protein n=1 Tax=Hymenobacter sp. BT190 TaxID=2763505 RepID=UPI0016511B57|nr:TraB/GumN family protein [Hymenobacter sp. BT190]MBC6697104.1 TraB/GumN family protein [Hymenobacter sp. BT190]
MSNPMRLFRQTAFAATLLLTAFTASAQKKPAKSATKVQPTATAAANSLLWEVSGKGLSAPSYVFGTIHMICPADMQMPETVKQAVSSSKQVVLEMDMDDPTMAQQAQAGMLMQDGQTLQKLLSPADYAALGTYLQAKAGLPIDKVGAIKPFFLGSMLMPAVLGCAPASYEASFMKMAQEQKKEVLGLETMQDQLGIFDKIPYAAQSKMLTDMVSKEAEMKQEMQQLLALYKTQQVEALREMSSKSMFGFTEYNGLLLDDRNQRWIAGIEKMAASQPTFFAVGAAHLGGPKGVLALLRQQGYQVKAVQ